MQKVGLSGRAESLLNKLGLNNALISDESEAAKGYPTIEYSQIKEKISVLRNKALVYLKTSLQ